MNGSDDATASRGGNRIRYLLFAAFAVLLIAHAVVNALSVISNRAHYGGFISPWKPFSWEFTSAFVIACLIPAIVWLNRRFPLTRRSWKRVLPLHAAVTVPFSIIHVSAMTGLRKLIYAAVGLQYGFGPVLTNWFYEYHKDVVSYATLLAIIFAFDFYNRLHVTPPVPAPSRQGEPETPLERLVVRKLGREFIVNLADVDHIQANGNYVTLYANGSAYPLRESLVSLERRLDPKRFIRVHRSFLVNIEHVREIRPWDNGDYRILLDNGAEVKLSRRYRSRLGTLLGT